MNTDHPQRSASDQPNPDAWILASPRKPAAKRNRLATWLAEHFVVRGRDLATIGFVFGLAGFVAGLFGALL